jgi:hypothetical protein
VSYRSLRRRVEQFARTLEAPTINLVGHDRSVVSVRTRTRVLTDRALIPAVKHSYNALLPRTG